MITTFITRVAILWIMVLLPALSYAGAPSGHYENHFDRQHGIWDLSGVHNGTEDDVSFNFTIAQDDKGKISGQGRFTFTGSDVEFNSTISGSIKSIGDVTRVVLGIKLVGTATDGFQVVNVKGKIKFTFDIDKPTGLLIGTAKGKICVKGAGCVSINGPVQFSQFFDIIMGEADGSWDLVLDIQNVDGKKLTGTALATLQNGREVPFSLTGKYNTNTDLTKLKLKGSGGKFAIQAHAIASELVFQTIKGKMLGQTVNQ